MKTKKMIVSLTAVSFCLSGLYADEGMTNVDMGNMRDEGYQELVDSKQPKGQIPAAFNHAAEIDVGGCCDIFATASFIYWNIQQEGMKIGTTYSSSNFSRATDTLYMGDEYKAGFKVGLGGNTRFDNWVVQAEYTWLHHALEKHQGSFPFMSTDFVLVGGAPGGAVLTNSTHRWHFGIDILDVTMGRPFYQGTKLSINPFFGIRTQWISQEYKISGATTLSTNTTAHWKTASWGIGPRFGFDMNFLLGEGFRLIGSASGSLVFTDYSPLSYRDPSASPAYTLNVDGHHYLRGDADGKLGFGWGSYLGTGDKYHLDFIATYDFQVLWNQNMITWMMNNLSNVDASAGNLYLTGLTVSGRFDF